MVKDDFEQAYYDLAGAQINNDEPNEALATLGRAREKFSTNFINEFFTALADVKNKDYTNAVRALCRGGSERARGRARTC